MYEMNERGTINNEPVQIILFVIYISSVISQGSRAVTAVMIDIGPFRLVTLIIS